MNLPNLRSIIRIQEPRHAAYQSLQSLGIQLILTTEAMQDLRLYATGSIPLVMSQLQVLNTA